MKTRGKRTVTVMFEVDGNNITLSIGDTGALDIIAEATLDGEPFTFGADDRALFSVKNGNGEVVKENIYEMTDNTFRVYFLNGDTDKLAAATYQWDVRYIIHPYYDENGNIVNGDQVITPEEPMTVNLINVVGQV